MGRKPTKNLNLPPRMRARKKPSGNVYYYYDCGGKPRKEIPLGDDYVMALRKYTELEINTKTKHNQLVTFPYAAQYFLKNELQKKAPRTQKDYLTELEKLLEFFGTPPAPLCDIKPIHIRQYMDWRTKEAKNKVVLKNQERKKDSKPLIQITGKEGQVRANREKALFSHIWNVARNAGLTDLPNPCLGIDNFSEDGRDHYIDDWIKDLIYESADQPLKDAIDLAYLLAQRPADTLKLSETDIKAEQIWIKQNKTGNRLRVSIEGELEQVIKRISKRKEQYKIRTLALICNEKGERLSYSALDYRFEKARDAAVEKARHQGLDHRLVTKTQFRDFRAKAGTDKEDQQGMAAAKDLLGHSSEQMTKDYVRHRKGKLVTPTK